MKILIVGLGEIGSANARYMSKFKDKLTVDGYDIKANMVEVLWQAGVINEKAKDFEGYDVYIVCVSTHDPKDVLKPDMKALQDVMQKIRKEAKEGALVSIESTVPLHTCQSFGHNNIHVVHVPHRYWKESSVYGVNQRRVLGSHLPCCEAKALEFYGAILGIPIHLVPDMETAEATKVVENMHRCVNIALAEEIKLYAEFNGMDFEALRAACNTKWNIQIMEAREGIGDHCLRKDTELYLRNMRMPSSVAKAALDIDDFYRKALQTQEKVVADNRS